MAVYYLDTSAIVKRYVAEPGSDWVKQLCMASGNVVVLAEITLAETAATFSRLWREGQINEDERRGYLNLFIGDCEEYQLVAVERSIINLAVDLTQGHPLRGYDAVQLAAALSAQKLLREAEFIFVTSDQRLIAAAKDEGLKTDSPLLHPDGD